MIRYCIDPAALPAWLFWHKPYFEPCPENPARHQNQAVRAHLSGYLSETAADEAPDGHLGGENWLEEREYRAAIKVD